MNRGDRREQSFHGDAERRTFLGTLAKDFQVKYVTHKIPSAAKAHIGDGFFADARDVFLHGLTGPERRGTCSSLPVLHVAVGRRLGYPLKLVTTKGHQFVESVFDFQAYLH